MLAHRIRYHCNYAMGKYKYKYKCAHMHAAACVCHCSMYWLTDFCLSGVLFALIVLLMDMLRMLTSATCEVFCTHFFVCSLSTNCFVRLAL